jgi:exopolysaccharide biosynthesis polyprenyl glycosylphosphotransferase
VLARFITNVYFNRAGQNSFGTRRLLVIADEKRGKVVLDALSYQLSMGHEIVDWLSCGQNGKFSPEPLKELPQFLAEREIDEVVFAFPPDWPIELASLLDVCSKMGINARILPRFWDPQERTIDVDCCQGIPFLTMYVNNFNATGLLYKRLLDIVGSSFGTLLFFLLYPVVAIAIKCDSPGPVMFRQDRVGLHGRIFKVFKFRSMYVDAEERKRELAAENEMQGPMFKLANDPRITRVGKFLRKTSLDELPQFLNVLRGEMSLVGTRPPTPQEVQQYQLWHRKRISAKPGITGLWQVSGRNRITDFSEVVRLDCRYMEHWSFRDDLIILMKTVWVVLARKGAC